MHTVIVQVKRSAIGKTHAMPPHGMWCHRNWGRKGEEAGCLLFFSPYAPQANACLGIECMVWLSSVCMVQAAAPLSQYEVSYKRDRAAAIT